MLESQISFCAVRNLNITSPSNMSHPKSRVLAIYLLWNLFYFAYISLLAQGHELPWQTHQMSFLTLGYYIGNLLLI